MLTAAEAAARHPAPPLTESKILRLRLLADHQNPKIRESVASSNHTPYDVVVRLSNDPDVGVRCCLARNETTPCDVLLVLAGDESETVRGFVAVNFHVPADVMVELLEDASATVRGLARWKASLTNGTAQQLVEVGQAQP
jgi:hypothetical protein